ncbi:hypothetical protein KUTeg_006013 [Tegillarca granosa]|uniref:beta-N-acetylhexosaminidase n=1 Tax=Tegillarca granosa TaxID=220873 RepID=A0ABQ9FFA4_TEGGR|nr:hypothetical protein KUTeg_006013 [Tegillarca granosa]
MAFYKMNKLKLCMSGNEGWRIEIPDYPELTQIGSRRCHDEDEKTCLFSQYGSDPNGQPQFFTATDYQEIVKYAGDKFIEIIPCINMAGQARAAIVAMEARRIARNLVNATLQDPNLADYAAPDHLSPNHLFHYHDANLARFDPRFVPCRYKNTGINPCLQFTYDFFETVVQRLKRYHQQAGYDLKTFDIGGDDTTYGAWYASSPACQAKIIRENSTDEIDKEMHLKVSYTTEIARLANKHDIDISGIDDYFTAFPSRIDSRTGPSVPFNTTRGKKLPTCNT